MTAAASRPNASAARRWGEDPPTNRRPRGGDSAARAICRWASPPAARLSLTHGVDGGTRARARRSPHAQTHCRQGRGVTVGGRRPAVPRGTLRLLAAVAEGGGHPQAAYCRRRRALGHSSPAVDSSGGGGSAAGSAPAGHHDDERGKPQQLPTIHLRVHTRRNKRPGGGGGTATTSTALTVRKTTERETEGLAAGGKGSGRHHTQTHITRTARGAAPQ